MRPMRSLSTMHVCLCESVHLCVLDCHAPLPLGDHDCVYSQLDIFEVVYFLYDRILLEPNCEDY